MKAAHEIQDTLESKIWKDFMLQFQQVRQDFYRILSQLPPNLTTHDSRLCDLLSLNMTSKDI
jgi:hypothetical protein